MQITRLAPILLLASAVALAQPAEGTQLGIANQYLQQGKTDQAIRETKAVLAANPRSAPAHLLLGLAYTALGSTDRIADAKAEFQQALDIDPELLWARFYLARLYFDQGLPEKARDQLERGLKLSPGLPNFLSLLGEVHRTLGDPAASIELNRKALAADSTLTPAYYFLALANQDLKQDDAAIAELEKALRFRDAAPEMYIALATQYIRKQKLTEAENLCLKALELDRSRPDAFLNLARIYNAQNASDRALEMVRSALPPGRDFPASDYYRSLQADLLVERGNAYAAKKTPALAIREFLRALEFDPARSTVHRRLAELYRQSGNPTAAGRHAGIAAEFENRRN